jgi:catechol 2,3-dioxygenase-like lactoylglutathione lyase family enzyme
VLLTPFVVPLFLWVVTNALNVSIKPLTPWLKTGYVLSAIPYVFVGALEDHKAWRLVSGSCFYAFWAAFLWMQRHSMFESLRPPGVQWYFPWEGARFTLPASTRILVRNPDEVTPWYTEKLGLREVPGTSTDASDTTFKFKEDGNSIVLTTRRGFGTEVTPMLYTRKIGKMRDVMMARGVNVGAIQFDRQGIQYFDIRDPEGNEIEVVQES